ncbi:MAG: RNA polymerase sigma factor, partial [Ktedonobacterales bacterium]
MQPTREPPPPAALPLADFEELLSAVQGQLFGFARGLTGDAEQGRDIVQEVYMDAWRAACATQPPFATGHTAEE